MRGGELAGYVFVDEVIGREDFITYAAGIDAAGHLKLTRGAAYRESHGAEIRSDAWRRQFGGAPGARTAARANRHQEHRRSDALLRTRDRGGALAGGAVAGGAAAAVASGG